jgi:hypothetical protein
MKLEDLEAKLGIDPNMGEEEKLALVKEIQDNIPALRAEQRVLEAKTQANLVVEAIKKIKEGLEARFDELNGSVDVKVRDITSGKDGIDGKDGKDGVNGKDGVDGISVTGPKGDNGADGEDGVGVQDAHIDFDGSLIITLTDGKEINVGEVVPMDVAEKIRIISNGGGTSQSVLDSIASLQSQIDTLIPSQTGNSGKYLTTNGTTTSWATVSSGSGTVTSVATSGTVNGITLTGGPITTTGTVTLGGTLNGIGNTQLTNSSITFGSTAQALGSTVIAISGVTIDNGAIGGTTAAAGTFTTLTSPILKSATGSATTGVSLDTPLGAQVTIIDIGDGTRPLRLNGGSAAGATTAGVSSSFGFLQLSASNSDVRTYTGGRGSTLQFNVLHTASAVDYVQVTGATTASKVVAISAQGSDTDVTLSLSPKGAGTIRFGTYTGTILTPTGYITITDSGGTSRRLLVG